MARRSLANPGLDFQHRDRDTSVGDDDKYPNAGVYPPTHNEADDNISSTDDSDNSTYHTSDNIFDSDDSDSNTATTNTETSATTTHDDENDNDSSTLCDSYNNTVRVNHIDLTNKTRKNHHQIRPTIHHLSPKTHLTPLTPPPITSPTTKITP